MHRRHCGDPFLWRGFSLCRGFRSLSFCIGTLPLRADPQTAYSRGDLVRWCYLYHGLFPGTPQIQNIIPTSFFKTNAYAAPWLGIIGGVIILTAGLFTSSLSAAELMPRMSLTTAAANW